MNFDYGICRGRRFVCGHYGNEFMRVVLKRSNLGGSVLMKLNSWIFGLEH